MRACESFRASGKVYQSFLENIDGSDYEALCGLVQALSVTDPERATEYAERLQVPSFDHLDAEAGLETYIKGMDFQLQVHVRECKRLTCGEMSSFEELEAQPIPKVSAMQGPKHVGR